MVIDGNFKTHLEAPGRRRPENTASKFITPRGARAEPMMEYIYIFFIKRGNDNEIVCSGNDGAWEYLQFSGSEGVRQCLRFFHTEMHSPTLHFSAKDCSLFKRIFLFLRGYSTRER